LDNGIHKYKPEKISLRDAAIGAYKKELEGLRLPRHLPSVDAALGQVAETVSTAPALLKGWALRTRQTCTRFSPEQRSYLITKFDQGARTGRKLDPKVTSKQMRREFPKSQWLTPTQIASYWSRLAHMKRGEPAADESDCEGDADTEGGNMSRAADDVIINEEAIADDPHLTFMILYERMKAIFLSSLVWSSRFSTHICPITIPCRYWWYMSNFSVICAV
jgi:hypothetical protein